MSAAFSTEPPHREWSLLKAGDVFNTFQTFAFSGSGSSRVNERRVPEIFPFRFYVRDEALMAYGFNAADQFSRAASYVDRILKGEKPGNLPVQSPIAFEFGINLSTARSMGLTVPQSLLIAADEIVQ